ncbi:MAG: RHS repeat-associated core domain-containing protein, partial [bacterium F082]
MIRTMLLTPKMIDSKVLDVSSMKIMLENITDSRTLTIDKSLVGKCGDVALCTCFVTARGYTKHYFEGSRRICSSVGGGNGELMTDCDGLVSRLEEGCIVDDVSQAKPLSESGDFLRFGSEVHRTSSSYGEDWVDISSFSYDTAQVGFYRFNGKEKDPETGFLYYGARYHWPEVWSGWLSPDPLMDVYPGISPYNYCLWNPVIFVDPDGRDTIISFACRTSDAEQNSGNKRLGECIRNIGDGPYVLSIAMHGSSKKMQTSTGNGEVTKTLTAKQMADRIINMTDGSSLYVDNLEKGKSTVIILYSCNTGQGEDCFGQQLSKELESSVVIAPEGAVWA